MQEAAERAGLAVRRLLDGLWRLKPRRGQPLVDMGGGIQLAYLPEQPVLMRTGVELGGLRFQPSLLGGNSIFECVGNGSATLHDTTSCLRVLTVGLALPTLSCRCPAFGSKVDTDGEAANEGLRGDKMTEVPFNVGDRVKKLSGYEYPGFIVSVFTNRAGAVRYVVEADHPAFSGMLHIFNGDQLEPR